MITTRYVDVAFNGGRSSMARALYQYDYGQILRITDLDLPVAYEVHFAEGKTGNSVTQIGNADGVNIPDAMLLKSGSFYAWFYLHETASDGETRYEILFPVMQRAKPTNQEPTPVQQDAITEAIAALNAAVEQTGADVIAAGESASAAADSANEASGYASDASASAINAGEYAEDAQGYASSASESATAAGNAQIAAETAQGKAETAQGKAEDAQTAAEAAAAQTALDVIAAGQSANAAAGSAGEASGYANDASGYATVAQGFANNASGFADNASGYATNAYNSAQAAAGSAGEASGYASSASGYASAANDAKLAAQGAQTAAETAQGLAEAAKTGAEAAQTAAETARDAAVAATEDKAPVILDSASGSIVSIVDGANSMNARSLVAFMEPIQDLHGYSNPWPAGGGKNLLNNTATTTESNGVTFTVNSDGTVATSGTATGTAVLRIFQTFSVNEELALNGCPAGGSYDSKYSIIAARSTGSVVQQSAMDTGNGGTISAENVSSIAQIQIIIRTGTNVNGLVFKPMLRLASDTDATFAPYSNICPISGRTGLTVTRTGKNLFDYDATKATTGTTSGGTIRAYYPLGLRGLTLSFSASLVSSGSVTTSNINIGKLKNGVINVAETFISPSSITNRTVTFAADEEAVFMTASDQVTSITLNFQKYIFQVEVGSSVTDYSAYTGTSYPVTWQTEAGTVYGGTVDVVSGVLTVDMATLLLDGTQDEIVANWRPKTNSIGWYYNFSGMNIDISSSTSAVTTAISDTLEAVSYGIIYAYDICSFAIIDTSGYQRVCCRIPDPTLTTKELVNAYLSQHPITVCYKLATPTTYQLTPTQVQMLLGDNNVWATGDTVSLTYPCDTKLYIEKLTRPTEDDMVANANIPIHKFFMIGNGLYYSTAAIAQGAAIIVGTNCNRVGLADALNALNS